MLIFTKSRHLQTVQCDIHNYQTDLFQFLDFLRFGFPVRSIQFTKMKILDNAKLDALSSALSSETSDCRLETRIELYSCKMVGQDKRLFKEMLQSDGPGTTPNDVQALSPPVNDDAWVFPSTSPGATLVSRHYSYSTSGSDQEMDTGLPVLCDTISRKTLFDLIAALNASFLDYDFSAAKGENFSKLPALDAVVRSVNGKLSAVVDGYNAIKPKLWVVADESIEFRDCKVYTYNPDYESDPYSEDGCIWSFNYFFYNPKLKRVLFFTCRALNANVCAEEVANEWRMEES